MRAGPIAAPSMVTHFTDSGSKPASLARSGKRILWLLPGVMARVLPARSLAVVMPVPSRTKMEWGGRRK
jgi:hypothetical protein